MKKQFILNIFSVLILLLAAVMKAQSSTENYVQSKICLNGDCSKKSEAITYFDGLGRPKQIISVKASPTGNDLVTPITYDGFGRQPKDILPVPASTLNSAYHSGITNENTANSYYGSSNAFAEKEIEKSPLDRVLQQGQSGDAWKLANGHTKKYKYEANAANEVKKFVVTTSIVTANNVSGTGSSLKVSSENSGYYPAGVLYKNTVSDEDGTPVIQFENGQGQVVLVRRTDGTQNIDTYYAYNEYNQIAFVIPPKAVQQIEQGGNIVTTLILQDLCYQYNYDGQNRQVEKKLPGKDWEFTVYDKQDRPVLTQDGILRTTTNHFGSRGWIFTKYDEFGRVVYTGFFSNTATRRAMQNALNSMAANPYNNEKRSASPFNLQGIDVYYSKQAFPTGSMTLLSVNYYDTYPPEAPAVPQTVQGQYTLPQALGAGNDASTKSLLTASYLKNIEDNNWTKNYNYYDSKGRLVSAKTVNHLGGYTNKELKLDFTGQTEESYTSHKRSAADTEVKVKERYIYDDQKRLMKQYHQVDTNPEELLAENTYNEIGQLTNKKTGNTSGTPLQSIDYAYNIRGWATKVNNPADLNGKLFGYELKYENPADATFAPAKYNGNISEFDWRTGNGNFLRRYAYKYDKLERLLDASYREPNVTAPVNDGYTEKLTYDLNGNIQTLKRYQAYGNVPLLIDDLKYQVYEGNRLKKVIDENANPSGYPSGGNTISYDMNGNMTDHLDKDITGISYNFLNLPKEVKFTDTNTKLQFLYRADGVKLKKNFSYLNPRSGIVLTETTEYLDGFQYLEKGGLNSLQFFPTDEGYYDFQNKRYVYNYEDHLGNIRMAYYKGSNNTAVIDRETNYYPFGMEYEGWNGTNSQLQSYTYGYNGKERQNETGWNDYGARMYMSDLGRWGVIDPFAETSRRWSPYTYAFNNPIRFIDPDGRQNQDITFGKNISKAAQDKIVNDLEKETGLKLSVGNNGKLSYTESSNAGGSKTARNMLKGAIDNHRTDYLVNSDNTRGSSIQDLQGRGEVVDGKAGYTQVYDLNINTDQIDGFIAGTSESLNPLTLGYGMVTLHEISHKYNNLIDGFVDSKGNEFPAATIYGVQGDNVKIMNNIRTELDNSKEFNLPFGQRKSYAPLDIGGSNFYPFSGGAYSAGPSKVNPKKDLYIKTPKK
jgi:RHS repeat-associated protein